MSTWHWWHLTSSHNLFLSCLSSTMKTTLRHVQLNCKPLGQLLDKNPQTFHGSFQDSNAKFVKAYIFNSIAMFSALLRMRWIGETYLQVRTMLERLPSNTHPASKAHHSKLKRSHFNQPRNTRYPLHCPRWRCIVARRFFHDLWLPYTKQDSHLMFHHEVYRNILELWFSTLHPRAVMDFDC